MDRNAQEIRERVTMRAAAEFYGFTQNHSGCIRCPFHMGDNQASLHIYPGAGGFCCFGCGAKGSVIDFVMLLFDCSFSEAKQRINEDFRLNLCIGKKLSYRERKSRKSAVEASSRHAAALNAAAMECDRLDCLYTAADAFKRLYAPGSHDRILPGYAWAIRNIDKIKYDLLLAEEKRWNLEQITGYPGMGKSKLSNDGAV